MSGSRTRRALLSATLAITSACGQTSLVDPDADVRGGLRLLSASTLLGSGETHGLVYASFVGDEALTRPIVVSVGSSDGRVVIPRDRTSVARCGRESACALAIVDASLEVAELYVEDPELAFIDHAPATPVTVGGLEVVARAVDGSRRVEAVVVDPVSEWLVDRGAGALTRSYEALTARSSCGATPAPDDPSWVRGFSPISVSADFTDGLACLHLRPSDPPGNASIVSRTVLASADVRSYVEAFAPPIIAEPLAFAVLLDLDLASEARCVEAKSSIESALFRAATAISSADPRHPAIVELGHYDLSSPEAPCRQQPELLGGRAISNAILDRLFAGAPDPTIPIVVVYVNNLDLGLSFGKSLAISELVQRLRGVPAAEGLVEPDARRLPRDVHLVALAEPTAAESIAPELAIPLGSTEDPSFLPTIRGGLAELWPLVTAVHDPLAPIPLDGSGELKPELFAVCPAASAVVSAFGRLVNGFVFEPDPDLGPAIAIDFQSPRGVPDARFLPPFVSITWEACFGRCDRAAEGATTPGSWSGGQACSQ
ncbi:MAG: hypothetical protein HYV07_04670 [Deltaproteobacteria bacterium]|nr:hypothetical protein [Deltaproteobacteria bacterium]